MGTARTVSVVVPTYGKRELLAATLDSLTGQTYPGEHVEVVVVDDCSDDDTFEFLQTFRAPFSLVPVRHEENRGRSAARNTAIRTASGDIVVFVDDDMRCDARLIEEHVRWHESHPGAVVIGNAVTDPSLGRSTALSYLDDMGVHRLAPGSRSPARYFVTNNASVERRHLMDVGLFDESFLQYGFEDTELAYRLEDQARLVFWYCAEAVAYHIHHHTLDQVLSKRYHAVRPMLQLLEKHPHRAADLSVDVLFPPSPSDPAALRIRKLGVALLANGLFRAVARSLAARFYLGRLSRPVMVYLIACEYRSGLRHYLSRD